MTFEEGQLREAPLDTLVRVAESLLELEHLLADDGEAEVSGLDSAGVHRADRNLMHPFARDTNELRALRRMPQPWTVIGTARAHARDIENRTLYPGGARKQRLDTRIVEPVLRRRVGAAHWQLDDEQTPIREECGVDFRPM